MNIEHSAEKRIWHGMFDAGIMYYIGCHMVDLAHMMQGIPERIIPYLSSSNFGNRGSLDQSSAVFEYKNGISFVQSNGTEINGYQRRQLVVSGTKGIFRSKTKIKNNKWRYIK